MKQKIIAKLNLKKGWGKCLNLIQSIAEYVLPSDEWERYLAAATQDAKECEGMDGLLLNGQYFDWKEFDYRCGEIVSAYLDYFNDTQLKLIYEHLTF